MSHYADSVGLVDSFVARMVVGGGWDARPYRGDQWILFRTERPKEAFRLLPSESKNRSFRWVYLRKGVRGRGPANLRKYIAAEVPS